MTSTLNIKHLPKPTLPTHPLRKDTYEGHCDNSTPIVIDNGATTLRWGWGTEDDSWLPYQGPNCIAKLKERRTNKPLLLFGEAIELESGARAQAKSPWEGDVLLNFDAMVCPSSFWSLDSHPNMPCRGIGERLGLCFHPARNRSAQHRQPCRDD